MAFTFGVTATSIQISTANPWGVQGSIARAARSVFGRDRSTLEMSPLGAMAIEDAARIVTCCACGHWQDSHWKHSADGCDWLSAPVFAASAWVS